MKSWDSSPSRSTGRTTLDARITRGEVGSLVVAHGSALAPAERDRLQRIAVERSRLGIPVLFGFDVIHGYRTLFPIPLGIAASWNPELAEASARIAASEASACGIDLTFSPMVDIARDPRWGRISEGSGEDVLLNAVFGAALVRGYQGDDPSKQGRIGACVKHFVGYGAALGGRDYQFTELSERALRETYLPPFKACVDAGAVSVMSAFNDISGTPASANALTLDRILRKEWGFDGFVLSDWNAVTELQEHGIAADGAEAAVKALTAGVDMEMTSDLYLTTLEQSVREKRLPAALVDRAVRAVLRVKFRQLAAESMVLLKNDGVLPLSPDLRSITVTGEWAVSRDLYGWWVGMGDGRDAVTVWDGIRSQAGGRTDVRLMSQSRSRRSDVAVVCVGENGYLFGENNNRSDIRLPYGQEQLIRELKEQGNKVVVVVFNGRPLDLSAVVPYADALLIAWHPGTEAGNAVADLLFGKRSPSGKLPVSFPKSVGQLPLFYSDRTSGRPGNDRYVSMDGQPLFPFGYGLGYTTFEYSELRLSKSVAAPGEQVAAEITVTNTGGMKAKETVQLYLHDKAASFTRPARMLIDFRKVELAPGESRTVSFDVTPRQLAVLDAAFRPVVEEGEFEISAGGTPSELHSRILTLKR